MLPPELDLVVHGTSYAHSKMGGIGAVLDGILGEPTYHRVVRRTIIVGAFDSSDPKELERLRSPDHGLSILYSSTKEIALVDTALARAFERVELYYHVQILYGTRPFGAAQHEVLLIDAHDAIDSVVARFKYYLWEHFGIQSERYQANPEYEQMVRAAEPSFVALQALVGELDTPRPPQFRSPRKGRQVLIAHESTGMLLALCARWLLEHEPPDRRYRTVYYAHDVPTARRLVEEHAGHDTRFYNVVKAAHRQGLFLEDVFGDRHRFFKDALLTAATGLDGIFAVSDVTMGELRFLDPNFAARPIALVYNGVDGASLSLADRQASLQRMRDYIENLLGYRPDWILTHVARLAQSKALWRDVGILARLDAEWARRGEKGVLITLACAVPYGRPEEDVRRWEREYGWPVTHRAGNGELVGPEIGYYRFIEDYNRHAQSSRILLVNQYGWQADRCGARMPAAMQPEDVHHGTDIAFGLSIYEPFGLAQVQALAAGALCGLSTTVGSLGLVRHLGQPRPPNIVTADYVTLPHGLQTMDIGQLLAIGQRERDMVEASEAARVANLIVERLPRTPDAVARLLQEGNELGRSMSWQRVLQEGLIPALVGLY